MQIGGSTIAGASIAGTNVSTTGPLITPDFTFTAPYGSENKHRLDRLDFAIDATNVLGSGETIQSIDSFQISRLGLKADISSQFSPITDETGQEVQFRIENTEDLHNALQRLRKKYAEHDLDGTHAYVILTVVPNAKQ